MTDILKDLGTSAKGEKSAFNFMREEDLDRLSAFFGSKKVLAGQPLWKEEDPFDYIAFIASGKVEMRKETEFGA